MATYKVYLTEGQWARVVCADGEIAAEVAKQQPELFAHLEKQVPEKPVLETQVPARMARSKRVRTKK